MLGEFVILRSRDQGVVCGYLKSFTPQPGGLACCEIEEARQIHGWSSGGANTLFEMSLYGIKPPATARISEPMAKVFTILGVCGVYPCEMEAKINLEQSRWNAAFASSASPRRVKKATGS